MNQEPVEILELNEPAAPVRGRPLVQVVGDRLRRTLPTVRPAAPVNFVLPAIVAIGLLTGIAAGMLLV